MAGGLSGVLLCAGAEGLVGGGKAACSEGVGGWLSGVTGWSVGSL